MAKPVQRVRSSSWSSASSQWVGAKLRTGRLASARLALDFLPVGRTDRLENLRLVQLAQDVDGGHDAMATDDSRGVFDGRKRSSPFVHGRDLVALLPPL